MANIMFFVVHQIGALNGCLKLSKDLEARGHGVSFAGLKDSRQHVIANGFEFHPLFEDFFPLGAIEAIDDYAYVAFPLLRQILGAPKKFRMFDAFIDYLIKTGADRFFALTDRVKPDLIILIGVPHVEWIALLAQVKKLKCVYFRADFCVRQGTGSPPVDSAITPAHKGSFVQDVRIALSWTRYRLKTAPSMLAIALHTAKLAKHFDVQHFHWRSVYRQDFSVTLPELIPSHPEFEFARSDVPGRIYIGPTVYRKRAEPPPRDVLDNKGAIVICALGTYLSRSRKKYVNFFRAVFGAARATPQLDWIVSIGRDLSLEEIGDPTSNLFVFNSISQLYWLRRASVMICHGGANTVKECILHRVPMVLFPLDGDHYGVSARATFHGLALSGDFDSVTANEIKSKTLTALDHVFLAAQMRLMQKRFVEMEEACVGAKVVETLLGPDCAADAPGIQP
jgi:zeaxanthin glucosyltransferase